MGSSPSPGPEASGRRERGAEGEGGVDFESSLKRGESEAAVVAQEVGGSKAQGSKPLRQCEARGPKCTATFWESRQYTGSVLDSSCTVLVERVALDVQLEADAARDLRIHVAHALPSIKGSVPSSTEWFDRAKKPDSGAAAPKQVAQHAA
eukprot:350135-Rhodomonas_salina.2